MKNNRIFEYLKQNFTFCLLIFLFINLILTVFFILEMYGWPGATIKNHFSLSYIEVNTGLDMASYLENANGIINNTWPNKAFFRAPLYSYILAVILLIKDSILFIAVIQGLFAFLTLIITYRTSCLLFDRLSAIMTLVILMLYGGYFFWIVVPHSTVFETFLATFALYWCIRLKKFPNVYNGILTGLTGSLLCLIRPNFIVIVPVMIIVLFLEQYFKSNSKRKTLYINYSLCVLVFILLMLPVLIWNNINSDKIILTPCTNGEDGYKNSNSYDSEVFGYIYAEKELMPVTSLNFWKHQIRKSLAFPKSFEYPQNVNYYLFKEYSWILPFLFVNFGLVISVFLASLYYNINKLKNLWPVYWFVFSYALTLIIFHIIGRYRIPIVPAMAVLGGQWLRDIIGILWEKKFKLLPVREKKTIMISIGVFMVVFVYSEPWKKIDKPLYWNNLAHRYYYDEDLPGYCDCLERKMVRFKDRGDILNYIAAKSLSGDFITADGLLKKLINTYPANDSIRIALGENDLLQKIDKGEATDAMWVKHLKNNKNGRIADLYLSIEKLKAEKSKLKK